MQNLAILLIGFSVFCGLLLILSNISHSQSNQVVSKLAGFMLLVSLVLIQTYHLTLLLDSDVIVPIKVYVGLLFIIAPCFYFYSRQILIINSLVSLFDLIHFIPIIAGSFLPYKLALPIVFLIMSI